MMYDSLQYALDWVQLCLHFQSSQSVLCSNLLVGVGPCLRTCDSTEGMQLNMPLGTYNVFVSAV